jgi:hypothetical protein
MIHKGAQRTQMVQRITQYHKAIPKPYPTIPFPNHTLYSREDPRPLVTTSSAIMIVVHFEKISTLYPRIVISSLIRRLENLIFCHFLHFLWCMAQISLHAFTKINSRLYVLLYHRFPLLGYNTIPSSPFHSC